MNNLPTIQQQASIFGASRYEIKDGYVDFHGGRLRSTNLDYLKVDVLICTECKSFWAAPKLRCSCGCGVLHATHESNKNLITQERKL